MQDTDFPFTVARAAPVLHRVPVHRSRGSITPTLPVRSPGRGQVSIRLNICSAIDSSHAAAVWLRYSGQFDCRLTTQP